MTLGELIERRGHKYDEHIGRTSVSDWYAGYMLGWKWAYQDLKEILEQHGFNMNVNVISPKTNTKEDYSDSDYYWEKAEFQDPIAHRQHVENYKKGIRDSVAFDEQYMKEAEEELKGE